MLTTVKVIAVPGRDCRVQHLHRVCTCPAALAKMTASEIAAAKEERFVLPFRSTLIHREYIFAYTGGKAAHDAFVAAHGDTPKHFLRDFLRRETTAMELAPIGKQAVAIDAMHRTWIAINRHLKWKHGDYSTTKSNLQAAYMKHAGSGQDEIELDESDLPDNLHDGGMVSLIECHVGPLWHTTKVFILPQSCNQCPAGKLVDAPPGGKMHEMRLKISKLLPCHEACEMTEAAVQDAWLGIVKQVAVSHFGLSLPLVVEQSDKRHSRVFKENGEWAQTVEEQNEVLEKVRQIIIVDKPSLQPNSSKHKRLYTSIPSMRTV